MQFSTGHVAFDQAIRSGQLSPIFHDALPIGRVPDSFSKILISHQIGQDEFSRNLRRTVMRYVNLSMVLVFRLVSTKVHARFPNYESLVEAKLLLPHEVRRFQLTYFFINRHFQQLVISNWLFNIL